jgi:hypothetical protein
MSTAPFSAASSCATPICRPTDARRADHVDSAVLGCVELGDADLPTDRRSSTASSWVTESRHRHCTA